MSESGLPANVGSMEGLGVDAEALCMCKDRALSACAGEWEPGCDLGNNPSYAVVHQMPPDELQVALGKMTAQRDTFQTSYEMAVERCVLAQDYMHPEQKQAFRKAWVKRRAELRNFDGFDNCKRLRSMLAVRVAGAMLYADNGELQDNSDVPNIDFKRDSVAEIHRKLQERLSRKTARTLPIW